MGKTKNIKKSKPSFKEAYSFSDIVGISLKLTLESINKEGYNEKAESTLDLLWHLFPTALKMTRSNNQQEKFASAWRACSQKYGSEKATNAKERMEMGIKRTMCKAQVIADFLWEYNIFYRKYQVLDIEPDEQMELIDD